MWKPTGDEPFPFPSLGLQVADAMTEYLAAPGVDGDAFVPTLEQLEFLYRLYEVDVETGTKRVKHRAVLSRPRGWGKSPFLAGIGISEALFEVVPDGFDAYGQPVGKPWADIRTPLVLITAVTEEQARRNTWGPLLEMLRGGSAVDEFDLEPMDTFVSLRRGKIEMATSSARSVKGAPPVASILDQTEEWVQSNGGISFAQTLRNNATKLGGISIESPNAFTPGENSVAEQSARFWEAIVAKKTKADSRPILYDHREAPATTDPGDRESLIAGLRVAYGDSSNHEDGCVLHSPPCAPGWSPIARIASDFLDLSNNPQVMRSDFLNQITHASDSWISSPELASMTSGSKVMPM